MKQIKVQIEERIESKIT
jgi:hypothetical protein